MAKHITEKDTQAIIQLIRGWDKPKMTWDNICQASKPLIGKVPTRQSLNANEQIKNAYSVKKNKVKEQGVRKPLPASLKIASDRIGNLEAENNELKEQNRQFLEQFVVWQYNAYKHGMTQEQLNESLPKIDRERGDGALR